jgi:hypothetical protein
VTEIELSVDETRALADHEAVIERDLKAFIRVGTALTDIRERRLYRAEYRTFEDYSEERWGLSVRRAYQLIEAASSVKNFSHEERVAMNESHARELARVPEAERADVWRETLDRGKPTATAIRETYDARCPAPELTFSDADLLAGDGWQQPAGPGFAAAVTRPAPPPPQPLVADTTRLDAELDAEMEGTDVRFRRNFGSAMAKADDLWQFDIDRIADLYAATYDTDIRPWVQQMATWCEQVERACKQRRNGLRAI